MGEEIQAPDAQGWKKVQEDNENGDEIYKFGTAGESLEGVFETVEIDVGTNKSKLYSIKLEDESIAKVWGSQMLDAKMGVVPIGSQVRIEYGGLKDSQKGGRKYKVFTVYTK